MCYYSTWLLRGGNRLYHIISATEGLLIRCLYYGSKKENLVTRDQYLNYGDWFEIGKRFKYIKEVGWFITIIVNDRKELFVHLHSIEQGIEARSVLPFVELHIEISILKFQLDRLLMKREKEHFFELAGRYKGVQQLLNVVNSK